MDTKCSGCDDVIKDYLHMQCSSDKCKKNYHSKCLALTEAQFKAFTQDYLNRWICPECVCTTPKTGNNAETPIRGNTMMHDTFSPSYVNTERGSGRRNPKERTVTDNGNQMLDELREFRLEVKTRLDEQMKESILLRNQLVNTETELKYVKSILKVVQEKANKVDILETRINELLRKNEQLQSMVTNTNKKEKSETDRKHNTPVMSFAKVVTQNQTEVIRSLPAKECVAMKSADIAMSRETPKTGNVSFEESVYIKQKERNSGTEEKWTVVNRKKNKYPNSEVRKGGSKEPTEIQGTEKFKYLHVWRLQKETTLENLENHVKKLYGEKLVQIKIEKIKHKTERDYASFIIGVPESKYEILCQPESWAVNIEFCEWVWFRRHTNKPKPPE
ncbi:hypothetical protein PYW07_003731 [Mythimna separata]|uniref:PHD-type domain-containing protein n=1 Tax=Mythimna separata TaxID=271217 RepID=A0AAD8DUE2_MYTSE|nr:hypothetical protein PYW07_003731 [Mythimna separata]